ncbi:MAG TPA: methyltransferase domain-containing protein [Gaiellaceae bacterium]
MEGVDPVAATGFTAAADVYERARPSYPPEAIDWLAERVDLRPGRAVVDVGAGTGKLTRLLVPTGAQVIAVEPLPAMLAKLVEAAPGAEALLGTAEAIPLEDASADVITVAQAFHWFDHDRALPELRRVLRADGFLVLVWNMRDLDDPVQAAVEELIAPARATANAQRADTWRPPLQRSPRFGPLETWRFPFAQQFTADDLCDRVRSTSFVAAMDDEEREQLLISVRELVRDVPEPFPYHYVTEIFVAPVAGSDGARRRG